MATILITGSRSFRNLRIVEEVLSKIDLNSKLILGEEIIKRNYSKKFDNLTGTYEIISAITRRTLHLPIMHYPINYKLYKEEALNNIVERLLHDCDRVIAFSNKKTIFTELIIEKAKEYGKEIEIYLE